MLTLIFSLQRREGQGPRPFRSMVSEHCSSGVSRFGLSDRARIPEEKSEREREREREGERPAERHVQAGPEASLHLELLTFGYMFKTVKLDKPQFQLFLWDVETSKMLNKLCMMNFQRFITGILRVLSLQVAQVSLTLSGLSLSLSLSIPAFSRPASSLLSFFSLGLFSLSLLCFSLWFSCFPPLSRPSLCIYLLLPLVCLNLRFERLLAPVQRPGSRTCTSIDPAQHRHNTGGEAWGLRCLEKD